MKYVVVAETDVELLAERNAGTLREARAIARELRATHADRKGVLITIGHTDGDAVECWANDSGEWKRVPR